VIHSLILPSSSLIIDCGWDDDSQERGQSNFGGYYFVGSDLNEDGLIN
jgi:hypothetical protein